MAGPTFGTLDDLNGDLAALVGLAFLLAVVGAGSRGVGEHWG
jgi:hypothetical protein